MHVSATSNETACKSFPGKENLNNLFCEQLLTVTEQMINKRIFIVKLIYFQPNLQFLFSGRGTAEEDVTLITITNGAVV